ncbi:MAG: nucleotidyl transferase AbiEii/AbiGii toxin family protein [Myxococcota bacterium]
MRHHLLEGLLRRLAHSPVRNDFVLRGGLMTRVWSPGRSTQDLDLVGDHDFDVAMTTERLRAIGQVSIDDGLQVDGAAVRTKGIWLHTAFPGIRAQIPVGFGETVIVVTADVGYGDPLVPPAQEMDYPSLIGAPPHIRACAPETQVAWKLHGLAECGPRFRPKDLADLCRIIKGVPLEDAVLTPAIDAAFASRGFSYESARTTLSAAHWTAKSASRRWRDSETPGDLQTTLETVRKRLAAALARLPA